MFKTSKVPCAENRWPLNRTELLLPSTVSQFYVLRPCWADPGLESLSGSAPVAAEEKRIWLHVCGAGTTPSQQHTAEASNPRAWMRTPGEPGGVLLTEVVSVWRKRFSMPSVFKSKTLRYPEWSATVAGRWSSQSVLSSVRCTCMFVGTYLGICAEGARWAKEWLWRGFDYIKGLFSTRAPCDRLSQWRVRSSPGLLTSQNWHRNKRMGFS